jgi:hypothetical protein
MVRFFVRPFFSISTNLFGGLHLAAMFDSGKSSGESDFFEAIYSVCVSYCGLTVKFLVSLKSFGRALCFV